MPATLLVLAFSLAASPKLPPTPAPPASGSTPAPIGNELPASAAASGRLQAYTHFLAAKRAAAAGEFARAIDEYSAARDLDPTSVIVRVELGEIYQRLRRYRDAAREAQKAVEIAPTSPDALELDAQTSEATGDTDRALRALKRLADLNPGQSSYLVRMASLQDRGGRSEEAVKLLQEAVQRDPQATDAVFELVERFRNLGRADRAIETLERAALADPDNIYLRSKMAELYLQVHNEKKAREALDALVALAPTNSEVLLEVARAFRQLDDDARASAIYRQALDLSPDDEAIRVNLATALTRSGDYRAALREYRRLLADVGAGDTERKPERFEFLKRVGLLELEVGDEKAALEALETARPLAPPDDLDFTRFLARAYDVRGEPRKALAVFQEKAKGRALGDARAVDLFVGQAAFLIRTGEVAQGLKLYQSVAAAQTLEPRHHGFLAYALYRAKETKAADDALELAVKGEGGERKNAYFLVATLLFEAKEPELAAGVIDRLLAKDPGDRDAYMFLARSHARRGDHAAAASVLERAVKALPDDADLHFQLGATLERLKRWEECDRELEAAIRLEPKHGMALNYMSYTLAERGEKLDKALAYALRAIELDPRNGAYLDTLGWTYFKRGELGKAVENLRIAAERLGSDPVVHEHLGEVLLKMGDRPGAVRAYEKAVDLAPADTVAALRDKLARARMPAEPAAPASRP